VIGSLRGRLIDRDLAGELIVEVAGVGYRVTVSPATASAFPEIGAEAFVHIHHHIREDHEQLFGFPTADERRCFETLLSAHGVGPALALAVLSTHNPLALARIVAEDDVDALCLVAGVGKKTAQRLVLELKSKLDSPITGAPHEARSPASGGASAIADVREALQGMGFATDEIAHALAGLDGDDPSALLRQALRAMAVR